MQLLPSRPHASIRNSNASRAWAGMNKKVLRDLAHAIYPMLLRPYIELARTSVGRRGCIGHEGRGDFQGPDFTTAENTYEHDQSATAARRPARRPTWSGDRPSPPGTPATA